MQPLATNPCEWRTFKKSLPLGQHCPAKALTNHYQEINKDIDLPSQNLNFRTMPLKFINSHALTNGGSE
jgi:hypothetical protein